MIRFVALMTMVAAALPAAAAETCETEHLPKALEASMRQTNTAEQFQQTLTEIDGYVSRCPEHPWINMMGAVMDMRAYDILVRGNNNQINQTAFNYLIRAYDRSNVYISAPAEARQDRLGIQAGSRTAELTHSAATDNRKSIIAALMTIARLGTLHPYLAAETQPTCGGWLISDSQTIGYAMEKEADLIFRPFVDAAADACSIDGDQADSTPIAVKAYAYTHFVRKGAVSDPAQISELLIAARDARDVYLDMNNGQFGIVFSKATSGALDSQLRKHGVDPQAGLLLRAQWFKAEHINSEDMQFSLAWALSENWAGLAANITAGSTNLPAASTAYTNFVSGILAEGRAAGLEDETRTAILRALTDIQESRVRAHAMDGYDLPPEWLFDTLKNVYGPHNDVE